MKKITKALTAMLLAGTTLLLMCGCDNGTADDKNSSVSGGNSTTQSTASDKSDASSKEESKADDTSSTDDSKPNEASDKKSDESNDEEIIEKLKQLPLDATFEDARKILEPYTFETLGSGMERYIYQVGKYKVYVFRYNIVNVLDTEANEWMNVLYPIKPSEPYDEKGEYPKEVKELAKKLNYITVDSTREDVIKALGDPDETDIKESQAIHTDTFNGEKYKIVVTYHGKGLLANIYNNDNSDYINIIYPDEYKNQ